MDPKDELIRALIWERERLGLELSRQKGLVVEFRASPPQPPTTDLRVLASTLLEIHPGAEAELLQSIAGCGIKAAIAALSEVKGNL